MKRAPAKFTQQDVTRALRAAMACGVSPAEITITAAGDIVMKTASSAAAPAQRDQLENSWDEVLK